MARQEGYSAPQILQYRGRSGSVRAYEEVGERPKRTGGGPTLTTILNTFRRSYHPTNNIHYVAKGVITACGPLRPQDLGPIHIPQICETYKRFAQSTRYQYHSVLRTLLRTLAIDYGAPIGLERAVPHIDCPDPRNTTITGEEKERMLTAASPSLRCFILLCSDLAIRSGTAVQIAPAHYNEKARKISFKTKKGRSVTLPVTRELADIFKAASRCPATMPYCSFLSTKKSSSQASAQQGFALLRKRLGMEKHVTPHDLRRTTAVSVLEVTGDIRQVQATLGHKRLATTVHYLDHGIAIVGAATLERAKANELTRDESN